MEQPFPLVGALGSACGALFSISPRHISKTLPTQVLKCIKEPQGNYYVPTLMLFFALVSTHAALFARASCSPSEGSTCLLKVHQFSRAGKFSEKAHLCWRSVLEPTMTQGISITPQKSIILSYTVCIISNDLRDATEYTRTYP